MTLPIFGNHKILFGCVRLAIICGFMIAADLAHACPACVVTKTKETQAADFLVLSIMGIVPIIIGIWVFVRIFCLQENERKQKS